MSKPIPEVLFSRHAMKFVDDDDDDELMNFLFFEIVH